MNCLEYICLLLSYFNFQGKDHVFSQRKVLFIVLILATTSYAYEMINDMTILGHRAPVNGCPQCPRWPELPGPEEPGLPEEEDEIYSRRRYTARIDETCKTCGVANERLIKEFILNGVIVEPPYKYPWMVALTSNGRKFCGGAIISNHFIITAAHCVVIPGGRRRRSFGHRHHCHFSRYTSGRVLRPSDIQINFLTDTYEVTSGYQVEKIIPHPEYHWKLLGWNDVALIKMKDRIKCDMYKNPICLPSENSVPTLGSHLKIAGWGSIKSGGGIPVYPHELLQGEIKVTHCHKCKKLLSVSKCTSGSSYCMTGVGNQQPCFGDSGAPMFHSKNGKFYIQGITSGGDPKCTPGYPFVYTSIASCSGWIRKTAGIYVIKEQNRQINSQDTKKNAPSKSKKK